MKNRFKAMISVTALGFFLVIALATSGLNESTNNYIELDQCEAKPLVSGILTVRIHYTDYQGKAWAGVHGKLAIAHQIVIDDVECQAEIISNENINFTLDSEGSYNYISSTFGHDNAGDLFRVEVFIDGNDDTPWDGFREFKEALYDQMELNFDVKDHDDL